jgi:hypothetical protein
MRPSGSPSTRLRWYETSRHPPQSAEIRSSSALIQRRAAPMPRVSESVSESVLRVPKPTSVRMSRSMRSGEASATISWMRGSAAGGTRVSCASAGGDASASGMAAASAAGARPRRRPAPDRTSLALGA